jgi:hypothetical protein
MTAPRDPDDLASALLDGLLTDGEAAIARRDPAVAARLADLAAAREAVRRPLPGPDPLARERGLAAALAAYDASDEQDGRDQTDQPAPAAVSAIGRGHGAGRPAAGSRATGPWRPEGTARRRWLTAAAVILFVVGLGVVARSWGTSNSDDTETSARSSGDESSSQGGAPEAAEDSGGGTTEETAAPSAAPGGIVDLGDVDSSEALADRARSIAAERSASAVTDATGGDDAEDGGTAGGQLARQCGDDADAERFAAERGTIVLQGRATLDGEPVDVWVLAADGKERVVAVDSACGVVVDQPLEG